MECDVMFRRIAWSILTCCGSAGLAAGQGVAEVAVDASARAVAALREAIADDATTEDDLAAAPYAAVPLTAADATAARDVLVAAWRRRRAEAARAEIESGTMREGEIAMPFFAKRFGEKPAQGHSLWISLHGGGGAPAQVNDSQWENQKRLYGVDEGIYVAPRAPTNTWNLWHEPHVDRLLHRLIEDFVVLGEVDPDRVYVLGYSAGGDGVYQLAPRMADHWAGAAMMAGHPNGVSLEPVRNLAFALQVGELDAAYDRNRVAAEYGKAIERFREADPDGYVALVKIHAGKGHWMDRDDAAALPWMAKFTRNPVPDRIVWIPTAPSRRSSYWIALPADAPQAPGRIAVRREAQSILVEDAGEARAVVIRLDDRLLDPDEKVRVVAGDRVLHDAPVPRTIRTLITTLRDRGDPQLAFPCEVTVEIPAS